jgi:uncharacterized protein (TIGR02186 family)
VSDKPAGRTTPLTLAAALLVGVACLTATAAALERGNEPPVSLSVSPGHVPVTSQFHGSTLSVDIVVPSGSDIALKLEGERRSVVFNQRGKVLVVWMNVGEVTIGNAPQAYMLYTSTVPAELASDAILRRLGLGLEALEPGIETRGEGMDRRTMLLEFYDYKKNAGLYLLSYGSLRPEPGEAGRDGAGRDRYAVDIALPSSVPVGVYGLDLYVFEDGELVEEESETVTIEKTGFPLFISSLARSHPGEYGLLAIVVAVLAGSLVGLAFSLVGRRRG